jgi:hypothetical protein
MTESELAAVRASAIREAVERMTEETVGDLAREALTAYHVAPNLTAAGSRFRAALLGALTRSGTGAEAVA